MKFAWTDNPALHICLLNVGSPLLLCIFNKIYLLFHFSHCQFKVWLFLKVLVIENEAKYCFVNQEVRKKMHYLTFVIYSWAKELVRKVDLLPYCLEEGEVGYLWNYNIYLFIYLFIYLYIATSVLINCYVSVMHLLYSKANHVSFSIASNLFLTLL